MNSVIRFIGSLLLLSGLLFNEWLIVSLFSYDSEISRFDIKIGIYLVQLLFLFLGIFFILFTNKLSKRIKLIVANSAVFFFSVFFALGLSEYIIRTSSPLPNGYPTDDLLFEPDSILGWRFIPNSITTVHWPFEASIDVHINALGFREEPAIPDSNSIWFIGDSFVSALEVDEKKRFTTILKNKISSSVYNFGVNGYGPVQYLLLTRELLKTYRPKHIYYLIYLRNDIYDVSGELDWIHGFKRPVIKNDTIFHPTNKLNDTVKNQQQVYLKKNPIRLETFHLYNHIQLWLQPSSSPKRIPPEIGLLHTSLDDFHNRCWRYTFSVLVQVQKLCDSYKIPFTIILAPTPIQVQTDLWDKVLNVYSLQQDSYDLYLPQKKLMHFMTEHQISFLDVTDTLHTNWQLTKNPVYFPRNHHWNERGHAIIADYLFKFIN